MEGNKVATYAVVALVVGILVGAGVGYAAFHNDNNAKSIDEKYSFYIYFGDNDSRTGWYSGSGTNIHDATQAFDAIMNTLGWKYEVSSWGYIASIDGEAGYQNYGWAIYQYLYSKTTSEAAAGSILVPSSTGSNGWGMINGYDSTSGSPLKLWEFGSNILFMAPYGETSAPSPASTYDFWHTTGPFDTE